MTASAPLAAMAWRIGVIGGIGHDDFSGQSLDQGGGFRRVALLAGRPICSRISRWPAATGVMLASYATSAELTFYSRCLGV